MTKFTRRELLKSGAITTSAIAAGALAPVAGQTDQVQAASSPADQLKSATAPLPIRMCKLDLDHPWYFEKIGALDRAKTLWDRKTWNRLLKQRSEEGYNAIYWWVNPWMDEPWQSWMISHKTIHYARVLSDQKTADVFEQLNWLFGRARELGMMNFLHNQCIATTKPFAEKHDLKGVTVGQEFRGREWGDRNELTRDFTEKTMAELFQTYETLDGIIGPLGDVLPGKRSTWYPEAIVPGLKRSGRNPIYIIQTWQLPFEDFMADIAPKGVYDNTWINVDFNGEMITDDRPYPIYTRWAERGGLPTIYEVLDLNFEGNLPFNGPRYAHDITHNLGKIDNCVGFNYWGEPQREAENYLFRKSIAYYSKRDEPYSDEPWLAILTEKYGDRDAAEHFLKAYELAGRITPEVCTLAWCPICTLQGRQLSLKYWYFADFGNNVRIGYYNGTSRGTELLPVKIFASVVARLGENWVAGDPQGADYTVPPHEQLYKWELADHPVTPYVQMARIRERGDQAFAEAEAAMKTVKKSQDDATSVYNYMKAYKLLADYYDTKVRAATAALIYKFGGPARYRQEAEQLADQVVVKYTDAANFIWENVDKRRGNLRGWGGWHMGERPPSTMPEMIEAEKEERAHFAQLFEWPANKA